MMIIIIIIIIVINLIKVKRVVIMISTLLHSKVKKGKYIINMYNIII